MFEARTIMTKDVIAAKAATPIYEAMRILIDKHISGLPVVDDNMHIIGIITEKDMLRILLDNSVNAKKTVSDYMKKDVRSFGPDDNIAIICEYLINNNYRRVPIVEDTKLVGIISRRDILCFILKLRSEFEEKPRVT